MLLALLMGVLLGVSYDMLRPPRYRAGKVCAALIDALFSLLAFGAVFSFAMRSESGSIGTWELIMMLAGFLLYLHTVSDSVVRLTESTWIMLEKFARGTENKIKKFEEFVILLFQNAKECFIIKK